MGLSIARTKCLAVYLSAFIHEYEPCQEEFTFGQDSCLQSSILLKKKNCYANRDVNLENSHTWFGGVLVLWKCKSGGLVKQKTGHCTSDDFRSINNI